MSQSVHSDDAPTVCILRNYNKFLIGTRTMPRWDDFYIHRFKQDFNRLVKFDTPEDAQQFLDAHPSLEDYFDGWIVQTTPTKWD